MGTSPDCLTAFTFISTSHYKIFLVEAKDKFVGVGLNGPHVSLLWLSHRQSHKSSFQSLHPQLQCFQFDALWQQRMPQQQLSQCVYSGSISGSIFMLSIIQPVTPPWAALPDREPAQWSYAVGESQANTERRGAVK